VAGAADYALLMAADTATAWGNQIDLQCPDAPALAGFGAHAVVVRTLDVIDRDRIDSCQETPIFSAAEGQEAGDSVGHSACTT
jgi:hypothetical protein